MRLRNLAAGGTITDGEWLDLFAILVQVKKSRLYVQWRNEEATANLVLGPDAFALPGPGAPPASALPKWRAVARDRQTWLDTLRARVEQERSLQQALDAAIAATETATLPLLRDALVKGASGGLTDLDVANWLTDRLLVDVKEGGFGRTTRVAQAVETLQGLLFGLRSGRFGDMDTRLGRHPSLDWKLRESADVFDAQWAWMASYGTWRSASMVYLYPENLLLPTLRPDPPRPGVADTDVKAATPAFRALVERLRARSRLSPQEARAAVQVYLDGDGLPNGQPGVRSAAHYPSYPADLKAPFAITEQLDTAGLLAWRDKSRTLLGPNPGLPQRRYIEEAFYFVPVLVALQLQERRQPRRGPRLVPPGLRI